MGLETQAPPLWVQEAAAEDTPFHESPFEPVTEHETASEVVQVILAAPPEGTRRGEAEMEPVTTGFTQVEEPAVQNCGETQVVRSWVEQSAFVCRMV